MIPLLAILLIPPVKAEHRILAVAAILTEALDYSFSVDARRRPGFEEGNLLLGRNPTVGELNSYSAAALLGTLAVAAVLPGNWRTAWLAGVTGLEIGRAWHSARIGLRLSMRI